MQHKLFPSSELKPGEKRTAQIGLSSLLICNVDGNFFAINNLCTHLKVPLTLGKLENDTITCKAHGACFNVKSGEMTAGPANEKWQGHSVLNKMAAAVIPSLFAGKIETYPVTEKDGILFVEK